MSLSCCSSLSVRLKSHDVSYTSVSMVTKSSHRSCSPGMWRSFPRRTSDRAQSTCQHQKQKKKKKRCSKKHEIVLSHTEFWCTRKQMVIGTGTFCKHTKKMKMNNQSSALIWAQDLICQCRKKLFFPLSTQLQAVIEASSQPSIHQVKSLLKALEAKRRGGGQCRFIGRLPKVTNQTLLRLIATGSHSSMLMDGARATPPAGEMV